MAWALKINKAFTVWWWSEATCTINNTRFAFIKCYLGGTDTGSSAGRGKWNYNDHLW